MRLARLVVNNLSVTNDPVRLSFLSSMSEEMSGFAESPVLHTHKPNGTQPSLETLNVKGLTSSTRWLLFTWIPSDLNFAVAYFDSDSSNVPKILSLVSYTVIRTYEIS